MEHKKNGLEKTILLLSEIFFIAVSYWILFSDKGVAFLGGAPLSRRIVLFSFNIIVFVRMNFTMFYLLKRYIPMSEAISVPFAFALYFVGFPLLCSSCNCGLGIWDIFGILLFLGGSFLNTYSEIQRKRFKDKPENKGKLFTQGFFKISMHPNYLGDILWLFAYAILTKNYYAFSIPLMMTLSFYYYFAPLLDKKLAEKYSDEFAEWKKKTKSIFPF